MEQMTDKESTLQAISRRVLFLFLSLFHSLLFYFDSCRASDFTRQFFFPDSFCPDSFFPVSMDGISQTGRRLQTG